MPKLLPIKLPNKNPFALQPAKPYEKMPNKAATHFSVLCYSTWPRGCRPMDYRNFHNLHPPNPCGPCTLQLKSCTPGYNDAYKLKIRGWTASHERGKRSSQIDHTDHCIPILMHFDHTDHCIPILMHIGSEGSCLVRKSAFEGALTRSRDGRGRLAKALQKALSESRLQTSPSST